LLVLGVAAAALAVMPMHLQWMVPLAHVQYDGHDQGLCLNPEGFAALHAIKAFTFPMVVFV
jgi:hypothetical protein